MANYDFTYTGTEIQAILDTGKKLKDSGYIFLGVATPSTNPGTPTQKVYYEAKQAGTYTNFGGVVLPDGLSLLIWNGSWTSKTVMCGDGGVFDISVYKSSGGTLATFADLAAALDGGNNIPASARKGGMSVKFVQSSDNKYVQYRLMADSWSVEPNDWAFCGDSVYVENPEWRYVLLDAKKRILAGLKSDASVEWSIGVPTPVKTYIDNAINEIKNGTEGTDLDGLNKIIAFLSEFSTSDTLKDLLDTKVDKEGGKSLIDAEYANGVHYIENPEFTEVKLVADDKIFEATMLDGTKLLPAGVKVIGTAEYDGATIKTVENPEFAGVWLDGEDKILFGVQQDGNFLFGCGVPKQVKEYIEQKIEELSLDEYESIVNFIGDYLNNTTLEELLSKKVDGEYVENPEFIEAKVDAEDKVLEGIQKDGTKVIGGDLRVLGNMEVSGVSYKVVENPEYLAAWIDAEDKIIFGFKTDGKTYVGDANFLNDIKNNQDAIDEIKTYLSNFDNLDIDALTSIITIENPEFIDVELDADNKIIEGTKTDGTKVVGSNLEVKGNVEIGGNVSYKNGIPQEIIDYIDANTGSGVSSIEYDDATGDMYATFNDADGVTDVYMDENGNIYVDIEE
jgi:hypothetical protein